MELDRVVKNKKHQPPHHLGQVAVVDVHGVQKKPAKTLTFSAEMCTSVHMPLLLGESAPNLVILKFDALSPSRKRVLSYKSAVTGKRVLSYTSAVTGPT